MKNYLETWSAVRKLAIFTTNVQPLYYIICHLLHPFRKCSITCLYETSMNRITSDSVVNIDLCQRTFQRMLSTCL